MRDQSKKTDLPFKCFASKETVSVMKNILQSYSCESSGQEALKMVFFLLFFNISIKAGTVSFLWNHAGVLK